MKSLKKIILNSLLILLIAVLFVGCSHNTNVSNTVNESNNRPIVAVSIVPEQAFVEAICGDTVDIVTMVPPGSSPANYEPVPKEIAKFNNSDIYFSIGVPTETANIIPKLSEKTKLISLSEEVSKKYDDLKMGEGRDPHIWLSPKRAIVIVETIAKEMGEISPDNKSLYDKNAKNYISQLDELDSQIEQALVGLDNKSFIVYHPAFGYLANDYGLKMYALEEDGKEPTPDHIKEMIDFCKEKNIKVIFYQEEIDSSQSKAFADEIEGKTTMLAPLSHDYINNLKNMAITIAESSKS